MARNVANVDIITDSFEIWLLDTNELLNALSTEIMTANATYANTGNSTFDRTAQLYGTFGANNLVVSNWVKGGNVNGLFANLMVSTNTVLSNTNAANIQFAVSNSSSNSYMNPLGVYLGLGTANSFVNSTAIITQNTATVNTNISPTLIQIANSTSTANINPTSFKTGIFQANTIEVQVGANVIANATSLYLGNSSVNSVHTQAQSTLANSIHSTLITQEKILIGNSTVNALANSTLITIANSTVFSYINPHGGYFGNTSANSFVNSTAIITQNGSVVNTNINPTLIQIANSTSTANIVPTSFKTGIFTGNTISVSVGANVIANAESLTVGNSTVNTFIVSNSTVTLFDTDGYMRVLGNADFSNSMLVVGNATFQNSMLVVGNTNLQNTLTVTGLSTLNGNMNTPTGNASVAFNVGANVNLTTDRINIGNNSVNTFVTSTAIETDGTLTVLGATTLSNTLGVTGATTLSNTLSVGGISTFKTDYVVDVSSNADVGSTIGPVLIYRFPKATYSSGKFDIQIKNGNTQLSEMVLAHDAGLNSYVTVYGTVASNGGISPLGTFTSNTDTANVNLYLVQTVANSAVTVVAHLIK